MAALWDERLVDQMDKLTGGTKAEEKVAMTAVLWGSSLGHSPVAVTVDRLARHWAVQMVASLVGPKDDRRAHFEAAPKVKQWVANWDLRRELQRAADSGAWTVEHLVVHLASDLVECLATGWAVMWVVH